MANQHLVGDTMIMHPDTYKDLVASFSQDLAVMQSQDLIKNYQVHVEGDTVVAQIKPNYSLQYIQVKLNLGEEPAIGYWGEPTVLREGEGKDRFEILILE